MKVFLFLILFFGTIAQSKPLINVGSKPFTESYILAEIVAQTVEAVGEAEVQRHLGLGATGIIFESLKNGDIDIYPEYTGTVSEAILKNPKLRSIEDINSALKPLGLLISGSLGFDDTYALAVKESFASKNNIKNISDLKKVPEIRAGFTHEFLKRADGFEALTKNYGLNFRNYKAMEHSLAYQSLEEGQLDLVEVYSTDAKIKKYNLQLLSDDKEFFPKYLGVLLFRKDMVEKYPETMSALKNLERKISETKMTELNSKVEIDKWSFERTAAFFLEKKANKESGNLRVFYKRTQEHLSLVFVSLFIAVILGIFLGVLASRNKYLAQVVLAVSGILQTIPSLALLCFLIPVLGIGYAPAQVALLLYALLPIVRNTYLGLTGIDSRLTESAKTLGLSQTDRLFKIELPLASPSILSGIKLSAVINVGTATLAAFIGAGGYGTYIVTGLALNDTAIILQGAVPSAILALLVQGLFEVIDHLVIPKGIRN